MKSNVLYEEEFNVSNKIKNQIKISQKKEYANQYRKKDKADRATIEQCLDPKTILRLEKLKNKGDLINYEGCISTGKEANVYYAKGFGNKHLAIKIYKTSILVFKDRERYISGEFRFRNGYCKSNPRKMIAIWAEKEVRNLKRIYLNGIKTPIPLLLKSNLIIMELIGNGEKPAPRLKDAEVGNKEDYNDIYIEAISIMKVMYNNCKLVHSDYSEYNLLYFNKCLYVIDVAQAVENDHPNALTFLKRDCININNFFKKCGVEVPTNRQLFDIVISCSKNIDYIQTENTNGNLLYSEEIKYMLNKARAFNSEKVKDEQYYYQIQNLAFDNFEFPLNVSSIDEVKIEECSNIKDVYKNIFGLKDCNSNTDVNLKDNSNELKNSQDSSYNTNDKNKKIHKSKLLEAKKKEIIEKGFIMPIDDKTKHIIETKNINKSKKKKSEKHICNIDNSIKNNEILEESKEYSDEANNISDDESVNYNESLSNSDNSNGLNESLSSSCSVDSLDEVKDYIENKAQNNDNSNLYKDFNGGNTSDKTTVNINNNIDIINKQELSEINDEDNLKLNKSKTYNPFEGLSKQERKRKVKDDNKEKRQNKKFSKYEKSKKVKKTSGKRK